jgi:hypothetical protein
MHADYRKFYSPPTPRLARVAPVKYVILLLSQIEQGRHRARRIELGARSREPGAAAYAEASSRQVEPGTKSQEI